MICRDSNNEHCLGHSDAWAGVFEVLLVLVLETDALMNSGYSAILGWLRERAL